VGCENQKINEEIPIKDSKFSDSTIVSLKFSFEINKESYQKTNFGEPPQIAIWIESPDSSIAKTVWITRRMAKQDWKGKIECPVALPFWEARMKKITENTDDQNSNNFVSDAVSGATPREGKIVADIHVSENSQWIFYIEVNVSADYNSTFSYWSKEGLPDSEANGQPSIIYSGQIMADGKSDSIPILVGRTDQRHAVKHFSRDLSGISSAKTLIDNLQVKSRYTTNIESESHQ
jgi:hypothetical protein